MITNKPSVFRRTTTGQNTANWASITMNINCGETTEMIALNASITAGRSKR